MEYEQPDWVKHWDKLAPRLEEAIEGQRVPEAEKFLTAVFGYFSFQTESLDKKVTKNKELVPHVYPMLVQMLDMIRANIHCQQHLLLSSSAFNLRVAFEIRVNLLYCYTHADPAKMLKRFADYADYESIIGRKQTPGFDKPSAEEERLFVKKHPYWGVEKTGTLRINAKWHGEKKTFFEMCEDLSKISEHSSMLNDFFFMYNQTSIFIHGSPIVKNVYRHPKHGLHPIATPRRLMNLSLRGTHFMLRMLVDFMDFFGVEYREVDIAFLNNFFNEAQKAWKENEDVR